MFDNTEAGAKGLPQTSITLDTPGTNAPLAAAFYCSGVANALASASQSTSGVSPAARALAISSRAASIAARNSSLLCSMATAAAPVTAASRMFTFRMRNHSKSPI